MRCCWSPSDGVAFSLSHVGGAAFPSSFSWAVLPSFASGRWCCRSPFEITLNTATKLCHSNWTKFEYNEVKTTKVWWWFALVLPDGAAVRCFPILGGADFSHPPPFGCCLLSTSRLSVVLLSPPPPFAWCCLPLPPWSGAAAVPYFTLDLKLNSIT